VLNLLIFGTSKAVINLAPQRGEFLTCSIRYRLWNFLKGHFVLLMDYLTNNGTLCPN